MKNLLSLIYNNPQYSIPLIIIVSGVLYICFGAVITVNNGFGYDGNYYGTSVKKLYEELAQGSLNHYRIQRIFPSFLLNGIFTIFNIPKENYFIVKAFQIYNLILLLICSHIWYKISAIYKLNVRYIWLGFILGFVNFAGVVMPYYYPVLTDISAFCLGFLLLYFHLKDNLAGKIIITLIGAVTWPTIIYAGILLIIFPINSKEIFNFEFKKPKVNLLAFLIPLPFFLISLYCIYNYYAFGQRLPTIKVAIPFIPSMFILSSLLNFALLVYFFSIYAVSFERLSDYFNYFKKLISNIKIQNVIISVLVYLCIYLFLHYFSNPAAAGQKLSYKQLIYSISLYSILKPLGYVITSITYYGPAFIILFFFLRRYKKYVEELGVGVYISFIISFLLVFTTQTRYISNFYPFIILFSVLVLKELNLSKISYWCILISSVILSKIYIPYYNLPDTKISNYEFPNQLLFMNTFTFSNLAYYIQLPIISIITGIILFSFYKNNNDVFKTVNLRSKDNNN